ncbi:MAG: hypothetical protein Q9227_004047 [Pyrenula ochraceoflavens]
MPSVQVKIIQPAENGAPLVTLRAEAADPKRLNLNLQATEGEHPFKGKVRERHLNDLRASAYSGSDEEWRNILRYTFGVDQEGANSNEHLQSVQVTSTIEGKDPKLTLTITFKRLISGISQRLGAITLKQDDNLELEILDWTRTAVSRGDTLQAEITSLQTRYQDAQATITSLETRLDELVQAKLAHENDLLAKFAELLNEKKLKIRNQQRLLATAQVNPKTLQEVQDSLKATGRDAAPSRKGKRRAENTDAGSEDAESDSSSGFEPTNSKAKEVNSVANKNQNTEQDKDDENEAEASDRNTTATETESEPDISDQDTNSGGVKGRIQHSPHSPSNQEEEEEEEEEQDGDRMAVDEPPSRNSASPPPQRSLPFQRKGDSTATATRGGGSGGGGDGANDSKGMTTTIASRKAMEEDSGEETASATDDEL